LRRKVAICARVTGASGQNRVPLASQPPVMPAACSAATASACWASSGHVGEAVRGARHREVQRAGQERRHLRAGHLATGAVPGPRRLAAAGDALLAHGADRARVHGADATSAKTPIGPWASDSAVRRKLAIWARVTGADGQ
jgi:hypothetical protein